MMKILRKNTHNNIMTNSVLASYIVNNKKSSRVEIAKYLGLRPNQIVILSLHKTTYVVTFTKEIISVISDMNGYWKISPRFNSDGGSDIYVDASKDIDMYIKLCADRE